MATRSGTGQGGKSFQDRELAAKVRSLALDKIRIILERPVVEMSEKDKTLHDAILIRMSSSLLPRLNEFTGEDGGALVIEISKEIAEKNNVSPHNSIVSRE